MQGFSTEKLCQEIWKEFVWRTTVPRSGVECWSLKMYLYNTYYWRISSTNVKENVFYIYPKFRYILLDTFYAWLLTLYRNSSLSGWPYLDLSLLHENFLSGYWATAQCLHLKSPEGKQSLWVVQTGSFSAQMWNHARQKTN